MSHSSDQERAARAALHEFRAHAAVRALHEHEAEQEAVRERTEHLRALRLAKQVHDAAEARRKLEAVMAGLRARARTQR